MDRGGLTKNVTSEQTELREAKCGSGRNAFQPEGTANAKVGKEHTSSMSKEQQGSQDKLK